MPVTGEVVTSLQEQEAIIERGITSFVEVGLAMRRIKDDLLFVSAGCDSFHEYAATRWGFDRSYTQRLMAGAHTVALLDRGGPPGGGPPSEGVVRPLAKLLNEAGRFDPTTQELQDPKAGERAVITAWRQVVTAHDDPAKPITAREVRAVLSPRASSHPPGWLELLGIVGDHLIATEKALTKTETAINRNPNDKFCAKATEYADWAEGLVTRLRKLTS